jgi:hypothetical protein
MMIYNAVLINVIDASVAKLVDARDLKSLVRKDVPVRLRPEAPIINTLEINNSSVPICKIAERVQGVLRVKSSDFNP